MILLNLRENTKFETDLIYNKSLDIRLREDIENLNTSISEPEIYQKIEKEFNDDNYEKPKGLKMKYFGEKTSFNLIQVKKYLETKLNI